MERRGSITRTSSFIEEEARKLAYYMELVKTIDGLLIKLDSILYEVREYCRESMEDPEDMLRAILLRSECKSVVEALACCRDEVERLLETPRFRTLKPYKNVIIEVVESTPCTGESRIECGTPQPTWRKQSLPVGRGSRAESPYSVRVRVERKFFGLSLKTIIFLAALAAILALELVFFR